MPGRAEWSLRLVRERCRIFRTALEAAGAATAEELEAIAPGGSENDDRSYSGWMYYFQRLNWLHGRSEARPHLGALAGLTAEAVVTDALQDTPQPVALVAPPDGAPRPLLVHPKAQAALVELRLIDRRLLQLRASAAALASSLEESDRVLVHRCEQAIVEFTGLAVWIVTADGPGLPYPWDALEPEAPAWTRDLAPHDVLAIMQAHLFANFGRLKLLDELLLPDDGKGLRPTWAGWFASEASERATDAVRLLRERSLGSLLAQRALTSDQSRRAHAAAQAR